MFRSSKLDSKEISAELKPIDSRINMIRYFDGYSAERMEELDERKTKRPLVKSYMLEYAGEQNRKREITELIKDFGIAAQEIDKGLYRIFDPKEKEYMGFLEILNPRYFVFYTIHKSIKADKWIKSLVYNSSELDYVWLNGLTFNVLWKRVAQLSKPKRYVSILFVHDSIFQIDREMQEENEDEEISLDDEEMEEIVERRASKFKMVDTIFTVKKRLTNLQKEYSPLYAISQLRFPSPIGRGGHDFYDNGKVTNRSGDFRDHRSHILYVNRIYDELMKATEDQAWYSTHKETVTFPRKFQKLIGAPVTIKFNEHLTKDTFVYWIESTFVRSNRFRLWGNPIYLGPTKVHVYGVDRHLWKPIFLELTDKHLIAILPEGTCGNTIHRLICNIQRYIDPAAEAYIGDTDYTNIVDRSSMGVLYEPEH